MIGERSDESIWSKNLNEGRALARRIRSLLKSMGGYFSEFFQGQRLTARLPLAARGVLTTARLLRQPTDGDLTWRHPS